MQVGGVGRVVCRVLVVVRILIGGEFVVVFLVGVFFFFGLVVGVAEAQARGEGWESWEDGPASRGVQGDD